MVLAEQQLRESKRSLQESIKVHKQLKKQLHDVEQNILKHRKAIHLLGSTAVGSTARGGIKKPPYYSKDLEDHFRKAGHLTFYRSQKRKNLLDTTYSVVDELQRLGHKYFNDKFHFPDSQPEFFKVGSPLTQLTEKSKGFLSMKDLINAKTQLSLEKGITATL